MNIQISLEIITLGLGVLLDGHNCGIDGLILVAKGLQELIIGRLRDDGKVLQYCLSLCRSSLSGTKIFGKHSGLVLLHLQFFLLNISILDLIIQLFLDFLLCGSGRYKFLVGS
jgi:hypothetical protein